MKGPGADTQIEFGEEENYIDDQASSQQWNATVAISDQAVSHRKIIRVRNTQYIRNNKHIV